MSRYTQLAVGALVAALSCGVAQSKVIYNFIPDPGSGTHLAQVTGGQLVMTDAAYRSGALSFQYGPAFGDPDTYDDPRQSPVLYANLDISPSGGDAADPGLGFLGPGNAPRSEEFIYSGLSLGAFLTLDDDGTLAGLLQLRDHSDWANAEGAGSHWLVDGFTSDYYIEGPCTGTDFCQAGTGHWQLDASTVPDYEPVPGPPVWGLFGLAVLGLLGLRRRA